MTSTTSAAITRNTTTTTTESTMSDFSDVVVGAIVGCTIAALLLLVFGVLCTVHYITQKKRVTNTPSRHMRTLADNSITSGPTPIHVTCSSNIIMRNVTNSDRVYAPSRSWEHGAPPRPSRASHLLELGVGAARPVQGARDTRSKREKQAAKASIKAQRYYAPPSIGEHSRAGSALQEAIRNFGPKTKGRKSEVGARYNAKGNSSAGNRAYYPEPNVLPSVPPHYKNSVENLNLSQSSAHSESNSVVDDRIPLQNSNRSRNSELRFTGYHHNRNIDKTRVQPSSVTAHTNVQRENVLEFSSLPVNPAGTDVVTHEYWNRAVDEAFDSALSLTSNSMRSDRNDGGNVTQQFWNRTVDEVFDSALSLHSPETTGQRPTTHVGSSDHGGQRDGPVSDDTWRRTVEDAFDGALSLQPADSVRQMMAGGRGRTVIRNDGGVSEETWKRTVNNAFDSALSLHDIDIN